VANGKVRKPKNYFFSKSLTNALTHIYQNPMTVITTPDGYGREIAVSAYVTATNANTLWINIPKGANESYFWEAFRNTFAEICGDVHPALSRSNCPRDNNEINEAATAVRTMLLNRNEQETAIVIDNFQNIPDMESAYLFLRHIAACFIPCFHIVPLSSRTLPISAEDSLNGIVKEINKPLFLIGREGIAGLFKSYNIDLTDEDITRIDDYSEGWLSALSALIIVTLERGGFGGGLIDEAKRRMIVYLRASVWDDLPEDMRLFLTFMSFADRFTTEQARYVCLLTASKTDAEILLAGLTQRQILIDYSPSDNSYRMHNILQSLALEDAKKIGTTVSESVSRAFLMSNHNDPPDNPNVSKLTAREWDVLSLLRLNKKYREIGTSLYISENTVKSLAKNIYRKLNIRGKSELSG